MDLFFLYATWLIGISASIREPIMFIVHIASMFLRMDSKIFGRRFDCGPFGFPGFCKAPSRPCVNSFGCLPVSDTLRV